MVYTQKLATVTSLLATAAAIPPQGVSQTPPMGFNNWARYTTDIHESIFTDAADAMKSKGFLAAGYNRINLDDAWSLLNRTADGSMAWDPVKFPKGLPWLTSHLKSLGFIPGIYTDAGTTSCGGYPAAQDYEQKDYDTFKSWGFEYLKMDGCNIEYTEAFYHEVYGRWGKIIAADKNPMVFSDSAPAYFSPQFIDGKNLTDWYTIMGWAEQIGALARHSNDVQTYPNGNAWGSIMTNYGMQVRLARYQVPGFFNDPDFLIVDNPSLSLDEKKSHFALWSSFSAPLILSTNLTAITAEEVTYLTNKDFIAVDQDPLAQQATLVSSTSDTDVLSKSLANGDRLVTIFNKAASVADLSVPWARLGLDTKNLAHIKELEVRELWTGSVSKIPVKDGKISTPAVPSHGTVSYRLALSKVPGVKVTPTGLIFNSQSLNCLTDTTVGAVSWKVCDGSDAQVWNIRADGHINSLLHPNECIGDVNGLLQSSAAGCRADRWTYYNSGNLVNHHSKKCVTESAAGAATVASCGVRTIEQSLSLPVGVKVIVGRT